MRRKAQPCEHPARTVHDAHTEPRTHSPAGPTPNDPEIELMRRERPARGIAPLHAHAVQSAGNRHARIRAKVPLQGPLVGRGQRADDASVRVENLHERPWRNVEDAKPRANSRRCLHSAARPSARDPAPATTAAASAVAVRPRPRCRARLHRSTATAPRRTTDRAVPPDETPPADSGRCPDSASTVPRLNQAVPRLGCSATAARYSPIASSSRPCAFRKSAYSARIQASAGWSDRARRYRVSMPRLARPARRYACASARRPPG